MLKSTRSIEEILLEERMVAYLDPGAEWVLRALNEPPGLSTTSSCMGRIALIEGEWPWERRLTTRIVYKTHTWLSLERIALELSKPYKDLWLKVTGPIIHVRVSTLECGEWLLSTAREEGFKHSGAITLGARGGCCVVEIAAPTGFSCPLRLGWLNFYGVNQLKAIVRRANRALALGRKRLARLTTRISTEWKRSPCS
jgi:tRNA wybutosine-synthesizing protein 3